MIIADFQFKTGKINVIFCNDEFLIELNRQFLNHDYYTDIITFNENERGFIGGELYISADRVKENSQIYNVDFESELIRVIVHGILHLIGLDDKTDDEKANMRKFENKYIGKFFAYGNDLS